jgi:hypothetical protein
MATGDQETEKREGHLLLKPHGEQMTFEMVHPDQGQVFRRGQGFGHRHPNQQGTNQPRPTGHGDAIELLELDPGGVESLIDNRQDVAQVVAGGQFRHNPTIRAMHLVLRGDDAGQDLRAM